MLRKVVASFIFCFTISIYSSPIVISSFQDLDEEWERLDEQALVVLDVDEVLITTKDHYMHPYSEETVLSIVMEALMFAESDLEKRDMEEALSLALILPERHLIEKSVPLLIKNLQSRGVKVIALTDCMTGSLGVIPKLEVWRIENLKSLGVDFSLSFPSIQSHRIDIPFSKKKCPLYEQGILFSGGHKKGDVLKAFLTESDFKPSKVIFIDDLSRNVDSVEFELKNMNIESRVYQYTGASEFFRNSVDEQILKHQFEHLIETKTWLSDAEIEALENFSSL